MAKLWFHIGTPKTGSTAIQLFGREETAQLADKGISYVSMGRRASFNKLAKALRGKNDTLANGYGQKAETGIRAAEDKSDHIVISSEMFSTSGIELDKLRAVVPSLDRLPLNIVIYLRRQDQFFESLYQQRVKNGRRPVGLEVFVEQVRERWGHYQKILERWQSAFPGAQFHIRPFDSKSLKNGDVVADFFSLLGAEDLCEPASNTTQHNIAPPPEALELYKLMYTAGVDDIQEIKRSALNRSGIASRKSRLMTKSSARDLMAYYAESNEIIRGRFFSERQALFDMADIDGPEEQEHRPLSQRQLEAAQHIFEAMVEVQQNKAKA